MINERSKHESVLFPDEKKKDKHEEETTLHTTLELYQTRVSFILSHRSEEIGRCQKVKHFSKNDQDGVRSWTPNTRKTAYPINRGVHSADEESGSNIRPYEAWVTQ